MPVLRASLASHVLFSTYFCLQSTATFADIKSELWKQAKKLPLFAVLKREDQYGFRGVNQEGELIEFEDNMPVKTAGTFKPILKVQKKEKNKGKEGRKKAGKRSNNRIWNKK
jgi:hypothetical protein